VRGEGDRALRVESRLPHFVGISDDMYAAEITIYTFREGITTIGAADCQPRPDIVLSGPGITGEMCAIEHKVGDLCVCVCVCVCVYVIVRVSR
jgi:hypothetical protein